MTVETFRLILSYRGNCDDILKVMNIDVDKDAMQSRQYFAAMPIEVLGKREIGRAWKQCLIIDLALDPIHQMADVFACGQWRRLTILVAVRPQVLETRPTRHRRTCLFRAVVADRAVD